VTELITQISDNFHFLRPEWLWALIPICLLGILLFKKAGNEDKWKKDIPQHLAQYLVIKGKENAKLPRILMIVMILFVVFAVAGPTWKEIDIGEVKSKSSLIIALDLSRSMLATDLQPNRLERAKSKIVDLLNERPGMPAALVGFAGTAHTILHFTSDYNTLKYMLEHSSPAIMPLKGTSFNTLFELADSLFKPMEMPGAMFILTDELPSEDVNLIKEFSENSKTKIEFLLISTPSGAPIPVSKNAFLKDDRGNTVIPTLNTNAINSFAQLTNVNINLITLDDSDIKKITSSIKENLQFEKNEAQENRQWEDYGYWFMIPSLLLLLLWFRRGWVVSWMLLIFSLPLHGCTTENNASPSQSKFEFVDLWLTKDQQAQNLFDKRNYVEAASKFENLFWVGVSHYKAKEFQLAAQTFYQIKTPEGYFNLGMCMAELENWNEAIFAFEQALVLNPDFDEAKYNIAEIKKLIPKKKKIELVTPQSFEDKFLSKSEELDQESDEKGDKEETDGGDQQVQNELAQQMQQGSEQVTFPDGSEQQQQQQEQKDILFKQLSDDPAVFLKRKFQMQYIKNAKKIEKPNKKW